MVVRVKWVAFLLAICGGMEVVAGSVIVLLALTDDSPEVDYALPLQVAFVGVLFVWGGLLVSLGAFKIVAALLNAKYRARRLGMVALFSILVSGCVLCPVLFPEIGVLVFGVILYAKPEVIEAFRASEGRRATQDARTQ